MPFGLSFRKKNDFIPRFGAKAQQIILNLELADKTKSERHYENSLRLIKELIREYEKRHLQEKALFKNKYEQLKKVREMIENMKKTGNKEILRFVENTLKDVCNVPERVLRQDKRR